MLVQDSIYSARVRSERSEQSQFLFVRHMTVQPPELDQALLRYRYH